MMIIDDRKNKIPVACGVEMRMNGIPVNRDSIATGGSIVIVMTRWCEIDLTVVDEATGTRYLADQWEVVGVFYADGKALWSNFWKIEDGKEWFLSVGKWEAQWQQNPRVKVERY